MVSLKASGFNMYLSSNIVIWISLLGYVSSLRVLSHQKRRHSISNEKDSNDPTSALRKILESLAKTKAFLTGDKRRTALSHQDYSAARDVVHNLAQKLSPRQLKHFLSDTVEAENQKPLRQGPEGYKKQVERELRETMTKTRVALLDQPVVEARGRNDFLVLNPHLKDPFVTVYPNNIYYNIEKKCVNWLDDCSLQGIKAKLLQKVRSPYR